MYIRKPAEGKNNANSELLVNEGATAVDINDMELPGYNREAGASAPVVKEETEKTEKKKDEPPEQMKMF